ncbi:glutamate racemase [Lampropedia puyangensis]|uniref:glutamate racemase n=1 Tax=Lampropedia puyangensis TaxID=1330072 RepID=UPI0013053D09|nr:aspartate/glutamate racemase family protein [Lampropedia puyangensis]
MQVIRQHFPQQDILYLADRASFPYGSKTKPSLALAVNKAINALVNHGAQVVVLASNAPSVMVLDEISSQQSVPVFGVYPPVAQALQRSCSGQIAVLGVQSLVQSREILSYVNTQAAGAPVTLRNASSLVSLVEDGSFLWRKEETQNKVSEFMARLLEEKPHIDVCTLSSTHLPWLLEYFKRAAPSVQFLDPALELLPQLGPFTSQGCGVTKCLATASQASPLDDLSRMLHLLGVDLQPNLITID